MGHTLNGRYYIAIFDSQHNSPKMGHDGTLADQRIILLLRNALLSHSTKHLAMLVVKSLQRTMI